MALLTACGRKSAADPDADPTLPDPPVAIPQPTPAAQAFGAAATAFGRTLLDKLQAGDPTKSVVVSPLSVMTALTMLAQGAKGATAAELTTALGFAANKLTLDGAAAAYANLHARLASSPNATVALANGIWVDQHVGLKPGFADPEKTAFAAQIASLDLSSLDAADAINHFVDQATRGKIPSVVGKLAGAALVLVSALYFKGAWRDKFDPAVTQTQPFTQGDGAVVQAPLMSRGGKFSYAETPDLQAVVLPYADPRFELVVVLAKPGANAAAWADGLSGFASRSGQVFLPRLALAWGFDIKDTLAAIGLADAMGPTADYSGVASAPLAVGQVLHKTVLNVDEQGAEAAASTTVIMETTAMPMRGGPPPFVFRADRPFHLLLRDAASGAPLMMAYVASPGAA
jgi:serpin B